jgi:carboxypeptidase family protein
MRTRPAIWLIVIFATGLSQAQITTTTMLGTVTDTSGAAVVGAQITVTNAGTNHVRSVKSDAEGAYRIEFLPVSNYVLEISLAGFKTYVQKGIVRTVNGNARATGWTYRRLRR